MGASHVVVFWIFSGNYFVAHDRHCFLGILKKFNTLKV